MQSNYQFILKDRPPVKPEHKRQPANTRIRLKLMPVLIKSREAAMQFPSCIQVFNFENWYQDRINKMRETHIEFKYNELHRLICTTIFFRLRLTCCLEQAETRMQSLK